MCTNKKWKKEEVEFLKEHWGEKKISILAYSLGRTEKAITSKASKLKLSKLAYYSEDITFHELLTGLGLEGSYKHYKDKLGKLNFPFKEKRISDTRKKAVLTVNINKVWKWIEKNQHQINFAKFEKGMLGIEPAWVEEKRNNDIKEKRSILTRPWTKGDDRRLIDLVNEYRYSYKEISERLMRTHGAVIRRLIELGVKGRPVRESSRNVWHQEQLEKLRELVLKRVRYCQITEVINKSEKAIRGKVYVLFGSENIDKAANNIIAKNL